MRRSSCGFIGLTTAVALIVSGCGGDDPTGLDSGDPLTVAEVASVLAALGSAFASVGAGPQPPPAAAPALVPIAFDESFNVSVPCDSGTVDVSGSISGTIDDETFATDLTTTVSWDPNACVVTNGTTTFTLDGAPSIDLVLNLTTTEDTITVSGTETGGFSFTSSDGRSGSCAFDVTYSIVTIGSSVDVSVTGTVCGLSATGFETLGT